MAQQEMTLELARQLYDQAVLKKIKIPGIAQAAENIFNTCKKELTNYQINFNNAKENYEYNHQTILEKMKNVQIKGKHKILTLTDKEININDKTTVELIDVMNKGHNLILRIRKSLTGQEIETKFIILTKNNSGSDEYYEVGEEILKKKLKLNYLLTTYGGNTPENPFSLAYEINRDIVKNRELLTSLQPKSSFISLMDLKREYLKEVYERDILDNEIWFDSKDAEIYQLFELQKERPDLETYKNMRAAMGGSGGYAAPFHKSGDVGLIQIKFFDLRQASKSKAVFIRFSMLNKKIGKLKDMFDLKHLKKMEKQLIKFFTDKKDNISNEITQKVNEEAQKNIEKLFNDFKSGLT